MRNDALKFLEFAQNKCKAAGIKLRVTTKKAIRNDSLGFFDGTQIWVCGGQTEWPYVLAHELGHLEQYLEKSDLYAKGSEAVPVFDDWLKGKIELRPKRLLQVTRSIQRMERDAERRALKMCRKFDLVDNMGMAAARASLHLHQYEAARRSRKWSRVGSLIEIVLALMPQKLVSEARLGHIPEVVAQSLTPG